MNAQLLLRQHTHLTWEDGFFAGMTVFFFLLPKSLLFFHLYTMGILLLVLSLVFRRGLGVGLVRMMVLATALVGLNALSGAMPKPPLLEVALLSGGGVISGLVGEMQRRSQLALERSFDQTLEVLARALECRDPYTEGHSRRTARYARVLAEEMGMDALTVTVIERAGLLHDLGKMGMPDAVLRKTSALTPEETQLAMRHPDEGSHILKGIPFLAKAADLVKHHHEHFNGSGYPDRLAGKAIPRGARIVAVADVFDALTTDRSYRKASPPVEAIQDIKQGSGQLFDPEVVLAMERAWLKGRL